MKILLKRCLNDMFIEAEFPMRRTKDPVCDENRHFETIESVQFIDWGLHDKKSAYPYVVTIDYR